MTQRPKIKDVARRAGVSPTLASFALNGREGVGEETRQRILAAAAELGYRANPYARALRTGSSNSFGLLIRNLSNPIFLDVIAGAQEAAVSSETTILIADADYSFERERQHIERFAAHHVDGLAIAPVGPGESVDLWRDLRPGAPTVVLYATAPGLDDVIRVGPDARRAVRLAVDHLYELGHRDIAFLTAPRELMADHDRLDEFELACADLGLPPRPVFTPLNLAAVMERVTALLDSPTPPTAVITNSDYTAHGVYLAARERGFTVGRDLSVVGHDDLPTAELLDPPLTTIRMDGRALGRALFDRLSGADADRAGDGDPGDGAGRTEPVDHAEPVELVVRRSTGPVR
ncbi:LacI family transcriptional regulator [Actinobacteria bacterium YIM 96077]|uniref:LacI family transcriptional regulator n=1 Tax=Phytoactinopolyspora halophila TaxID=1981511 RepID=A0A329QN12_9ACTN|nr:LacI family DNA-binding transcriptional regulator [Phytoactinopolyspora halophila]AYY12352.1 LacI family transcriptional regulator [Actinobacteria bacterium YIM 96077]RAW13730.1 LacI family transcriptional regulator [Phytoactinopolyspora halophila]